MVEYFGQLANTPALQTALFYFGLVYTIFIWGACALAYSRNAHLSTDDPERREYHIAALALAPFTLPLIVVFWLLYLALRTVLVSLLFGALLILFPFCLIIFNSTSILQGPIELYQKIGDKLLRANTFLLRLTGLFSSPA